MPLRTVFTDDSGLFPLLQLYSGLRVNISGVLGVRIALVSVTTWTSGDQIQVVSNPDTLLSNFEAYAPQISDPHDSAMLITYVRHLTQLPATIQNLIKVSHINNCTKALINATCTIFTCIWMVCAFLQVS